MSEEAKIFMGIPERWYGPAKWRCKSGHVSRRVLKSEAAGDLCLDCQESVRVTFPEDEEGSPLGAEIFALRMKHSEEVAKRGSELERAIDEETASPLVDEFMSKDDLTAAADRIRAEVDWSRLPKLAAIFEHRPSVNVYWHELVVLALRTLEHGPKQWTEARTKAEAVVRAVIPRVQLELLIQKQATRSSALFRALVEGGYIDQDGKPLWP